MKKAFTTLEMLLGCAIIMLFLPLITTIYFHMRQHQKLPHYLPQLRQLQLIMALSTEYQLLDPHTLKIHYLNEDYTISFHRNRLVKRPGYQILFTNIPEGQFLKEDQCLILEIRHHRMRLRCEQSLP